MNINDIEDEDGVGCLCLFYNSCDNDVCLGILKSYNPFSSFHYTEEYTKKIFEHCRPLERIDFKIYSEEYEIVDLRKNAKHALECLVMEQKLRSVGKHTHYSWVQNNGETKRMKSMTDSHLENAIKYCEDRIQRDRIKLEVSQEDMY